MNNLGYFIGITSNACPYDPQELDTFRLVSKDTNEVATLNQLWSLFARSVGCDFLHSRDDVKLYFADLKKIAKKANVYFFPCNQSEGITSQMYVINNRSNYSSLEVAPSVEDFSQLQRVRENVDIEKFWHSIFGKTNRYNCTNRRLRQNFNNKITKFHEMHPLYPTHITLLDIPVLDLSGKELTYLPTALSKIPVLQHLNLSNNEFRAVSEGIAEFQNLKSLSLSGNQIERIPSEVGALTNLQRLDLSNNQIRQLPYAVKNLPNCEIVLDGNPITEKRDGEELESSPKRQKPDQ